MTDQTSNDSGSRRLRREEERRRLAMEQGLPSGSERARRDDLSPLDSPVERSWQDDAPRVRPELGRGAESPPSGRPQQQALSRRELRERAAGVAGRPAEGRPPSEDSPATRRLTDPSGPIERPSPSEPDRLDGPAPAPAASERPLSRRELRERVEGSTGDSGIYRSRPEEVRGPEPARPSNQGGYADARGESLGRRAAQGHSPDLPDGRYGSPSGQVEGSPDGSSGPPPARRDRSRRAELPEPEARRDAPRFEAPREDSPRYEAPRYDTPAPVTEPGPLDSRERHHSNGAEQGPTGHEGPARPERPERLSAAVDPEREQPASDLPESPEAESVTAPEPPPRISPQARAAAIKAQAARAQAEREDATREHYERLQSRRAAKEAVEPQPAAGTAPAQSSAPAQQPGQPPSTMWGQRQDAGGAPPAVGSEAAGFADRPPVRRVVLPASMSAGTSPTDVPVLGQWQSQPQHYQAAAQTPPPSQPQPQPQPQPAPQQPQQPHQAAPQQYQAAPPQQRPHQAPQQPQQYQAQQQYQGIPQSGPMQTNGQPFATVSMAAQTATAPARPATGGPGFPPNPDGSGPLPRWGSVGGSGAWSPTPAYVPNGQAPAGPITGPQPEDDEEDSERRHPYTWLHMIVLVLVAFVLGMLIFMLLIKNATENGAAAQVIEGSLAQVTERAGA